MTQYLHELYIGKTKSLLEIERLIGQARNKFFGIQYSKAVRINSSKEFYDINRAFEKMFGFKIFSLTIIPSTQVNAYTAPISYALDLGPQFRIKKNLITDSSGFKFKKEAGYVCTVCMYSGMFFNKEYTDGEILSIILHEIGHNFQSVLNRKIYYLQDLTSITSYILAFAQNILSGDFQQLGRNAFSIITNTNIVKMIDVKMSDIVSKISGVNVVFGVLSMIGGAMGDLNMNILYIIGQIYKYSTLPMTVFASIIGKVLSPLGKESERVADTFVQVYGYGPELSSFVTKIGHNDSGILVRDASYSMPVFGKFMELYDLPYDMILSAFDEHPTGIQRAMMVKKTIELELEKNDIDTVLKAKLKQDLKDLDKVLDEYDKISTDQLEPGAMKMAWFKYIYDFQDKENTRATKRISGDIDNIFSSTKLR